MVLTSHVYLNRCPQSYALIIDLYITNKILELCAATVKHILSNYSSLMQ